jgi:hypothetical protein
VGWGGNKDDVTSDGMTFVPSFIKSISWFKTYGEQEHGHDAISLVSYMKEEKKAQNNTSNSMEQSVILYIYGSY